MASFLPKSVQKVIEEFQKLPGVGPKSAARMAYHYLRSPHNDASRLSGALKEMDENVSFCGKCFNVTDEEVCDICTHPTRDKNKLCIVEEPLDISAFENSAVFNGRYFVLGGVISPAEGIGPEEIRFKELAKRVAEIVEESGEVEVIVATNPSLEGEATAAYLLDLLKDAENVSVTRLAMGLPTGADVEYADRLTLKRALEGRSTY